MTSGAYPCIDQSQLVKRRVPMGTRILQKKPMETNTTTPGMRQAKSYSLCSGTAELPGRGSRGKSG